MNPAADFAATWRSLMGTIARAAGALDAGDPPIVLSSLPDLAGSDAHADAPARLSFIHGPPGRLVALAIGLRAARPHTPLVLLMNADSVTLGTNHLIHAARRNIGMTLLLLRSDLTADASDRDLDRAAWAMPVHQQAIETRTKPLEWVGALDAALVARANLRRPGELGELLARALATPGFCVLGVTADDALPSGVLSHCEWPEYFAAYREWAAPLRRADEPSRPEAAPPAAPRRAVPRVELRIAGLGGQGVKLAGTVLSEAAGLHEGLWATQRGDYGSATRGGPSMVDVVIGSDPITYPNADHPDVLVLLTQGAADRWAARAGASARIVADPGEVKRLPEGALAVPITALAREHTGKPIAAGMVAVGCVAALSQAVDLDALAKSIAANMPEALVAANIAACEAGFAATRAALEKELACPAS